MKTLLTLPQGQGFFYLQFRVTNTFLAIIYGAFSLTSSAADRKIPVEQKCFSWFYVTQDKEMSSGRSDAHASQYLNRQMNPHVEVKDQLP